MMICFFVGKRTSNLEAMATLPPQKPERTEGRGMQSTQASRLAVMDIAADMNVQTSKELSFALPQTEG